MALKMVSGARAVGFSCPHCGQFTMTDYGQSTRSYPTPAEAVGAVNARLGKIDRLSMKRVTSATIRLDGVHGVSVTYYLTVVDDDTLFCEV